MSIFDAYRSDPVRFVEDELHVHPWSKQRDVLEAIRDHDRVAVKSGNSVGKSMIAASSVLWWLAGGPGSVCVSTSATERNLKRVMWREIAKKHARSRDLFAGAVLTDTELYLAPDWYAVGFSTDVPEAFQGVHAERVLVVVDEASGVSEDTYGAIEGILASGDAKLLLISNPLRTSGTFFDAFHSQRDEYHCISISALETPAYTGEQVPADVTKSLASRKWVDRQARRGTDSNEYRIRVLGEFPKTSDDGVVSLADLEHAQAQTIEPGLPVVIGVDVARFGADKTVVALRRGNVIRVVRSTARQDLMATAGMVTLIAREVADKVGRKPVIVVDDTGLGGGLTDRLRELREFKTVDFNGGRRARSSDYVNRRSELWFTAAEVLPLLDLDPADEELAADLLAPVYALRSEGKRAVEQKVDTRKRLRRSPDRADAMLLTLVVHPPQAPGRVGRRTGSISIPRGRFAVAAPTPRRMAIRNDAELAATIGLVSNDVSSPGEVDRNRTGRELRHAHVGSWAAGQLASRAARNATNSSTSPRGRSLDELTASVRMPREVLRDVLRDEQRRGHVTVDDQGRYRPTPELERRYGRALRSMTTTTEEGK